MTRKRNQTCPVGSPLSGNISDNSSKEQDRFFPIANANRIMKKDPSPSMQKYPKKPKRQCKNVRRSSSVLSLARPPRSVRGRKGIVWLCRFPITQLSFYIV
ncbi:hypothetical protein J1N35_030712 [Gossypium stocksii]|uniref:Uncharacterized protein n=1 Tax=Gossypium stocksii TaxID=47602 RepID=A0A9D3ZUM8_9ROSI|nr:hypothetical protein J1N35_030712 [Gossypium stocksii]